MTPDDLVTIFTGDTLIWHKPGKAAAYAEAVTYLYPVEDPAAAAKGRVWVRTYQDKLRTVNLKNCTRPT